MNQVLLNFCLALAANELIHNVFEIKNMREKLKRLTAYMDKKPYKELPINIDTRLKSYAISLVAFVVFVGPLWLVFTWFNLNTTTALKTLLVLLVLSYAVTAVTVDAWHVDIEKITRRFKK